MRRAYAIIKATALEILSEPLVFLVMVSAMSLSVLAPAMHYHEFGEPDRMARDAGVSALLLGGLVIAAFGAVKSVRRELETQTALTALALPVSRTCFFLSKVAGVAAAYAFFAVTIVLESLVVVRGSVVGGQLAAARGLMARIYGPSFAIAVAAIVLPFVYGGLVNRFFRKRFVLNANLSALVVSIAGFAFNFDSELVLRTLPLYLLVALPALVLLCASAAFSVRFKFNVAASLAVGVFALFLPALGNYCLTDVLSAGESIGVVYFLIATLSVLPVLALLLFLGVKLFEYSE